MGIVRLSGPESFAIAKRCCPPLPPFREVALRAILDSKGERLDEGLVVAFPQPHSFTGEDVVEIHAHGSPVVLNLITQSLVDAGARPAEPGEFSKRAYLNDRIDLVQAEAIADLIEASTEQAARAAGSSLQGEFSKKIQALVTDLTELRVYVEASLDFPDEDVDFLADGQVSSRASELLVRVDELMTQAKQGARLISGARVALVGEPNAGKSSLLNALAQREAAIVTEVAGTTRDVVTEHLNMGGLAVTVADTAGLRETQDPVESIGIERAAETMAQSDLIIWVIDAQALGELGLGRQALISHALFAELQRDYPQLGDSKRVLPVVNKIDLIDGEASFSDDVVWCSAMTMAGMDKLHQAITERLGVMELSEGVFSARARHLDALDRAHGCLQQGVAEIEATQSGELLAESLRESAEALGEITGQISADELLGKIFSSFCIGK